MPYIPQEKRDVLDATIDGLHILLVGLELDDPENNMEGNLNYILTRLFQMVYGDQDTTRYSSINDAIGVLECVKQEFYRKVAAPYENQKIFDNGDVQRFLTQPRVLEIVTVQKEEENGPDATDEVL